MGAFEFASLAASASHLSRKLGRPEATSGVALLGLRARREFDLSFHVGRMV